MATILAHMSRIERIEPGPGQESVWDYPRPPRLEPTTRHLVVVVGDTTIADTRRGHRVLETSQPPAYYFPPDDVRTDLLAETTTRTFCEWKGQAAHHAVILGNRRVDDIAWNYPHPVTAFEAIAGHFAFYPSRVDACYVDDELVQPMDGSFYGGWVTSDVVGPFKGGAGTAHW
jgi:uncharacterized protein (DUF427 family)